jgi:ATP-dependent RNA/DNA helicase IGHMBP2
LSKQDEVTESEMRTDLRTRVDAFLSGQDLVLHFPCELTAQERRLVHEMAEELGLAHESVGEAKTRHIVLTKQTAETLAAGSAHQKEGSAAADEPPAAGVSQPAGDVSLLVVCNKCKKSVAKANMELHKYRCQVQPVPGPSKTSVSSSSSSSSQMTKKKNSAPVKKLPSASKEGTEDFDAICEQFQVPGDLCFCLKSITSFSHKIFPSGGKPVFVFIASPRAHASRSPQHFLQLSLFFLSSHLPPTAAFSHLCIARYCRSPGSRF